MVILFPSKICLWYLLSDYTQSSYLYEEMFDKLVIVAAMTFTNLWSLTIDHFLIPLSTRKAPMIVATASTNFYIILTGKPVMVHQILHWFFLATFNLSTIPDVFLMCESGSVYISWVHYVENCHPSKPKWSWSFSRLISIAGEMVTVSWLSWLQHESQLPFCSLYLKIILAAPSDKQLCGHDQCRKKQPSSCPGCCSCS